MHQGRHAQIWEKFPAKETVSAKALHACAHTHTRTHARTHTYTHTQQTYTHLMCLKSRREAKEASQSRMSEEGVADEV